MLFEFAHMKTTSPRFQSAPVVPRTPQPPGPFFWGAFCVGRRFSLKVAQIARVGRSMHPMGHLGRCDRRGAAAGHQKGPRPPLGRPGRVPNWVTKIPPPSPQWPGGATPRPLGLLDRLGRRSAAKNDPTRGTAGHPGFFFLAGKSRSRRRSFGLPDRQGPCASKGGAFRGGARLEPGAAP